MTQKHALVQGMNPRQEEAVLHTEGPLLVMVVLVVENAGFNTPNCLSN